MLPLLHKVELDDLAGVGKDHSFTVIVVKVDPFANFRQLKLNHVDSFELFELIHWVSLQNDHFCDDFFAIDAVLANGYSNELTVVTRFHVDDFNVFSSV